MQPLHGSWLLGADCFSCRLSLTHHNADDCRLRMLGGACPRASRSLYYISGRVHTINLENVCGRCRMCWGLEGREPGRLRGAPGQGAPIRIKGAPRRRQTGERIGRLSRGSPTSGPPSLSLSPAPFPPFHHLSASATSPSQPWESPPPPPGHRSRADTQSPSALRSSAPSRPGRTSHHQTPSMNATIMPSAVSTSPSCTALLHAGGLRRVYPDGFLPESVDLAKPSTAQVRKGEANRKVDLQRGSVNVSGPTLSLCIWLTRCIRLERRRSAPV